MQNSDGNKELLAIHGQDYFHSEATIVGNTESLKRLRDAIDKCLNAEEKEIAGEPIKISHESFIQEDGEGYDLIIIADDKKFTWEQEKGSNYPTAYIDDVAKCHDESRWKYLNDKIYAYLKPIIEERNKKH